ESLIAHTGLYATDVKKDFMYHSSKQTTLAAVGVETVFEDIAKKVYRGISALWGSDTSVYIAQGEDTDLIEENTGIDLNIETEPLQEPQIIERTIIKEVPVEIVGTPTVIREVVET